MYNNSMKRGTFNTLMKKLNHAEELIMNGGAGSGNFGHAGRPGERGGSAPQGAYTKSDQIKDLHKAGQITDSERDELLAKAKADGTDKDRVESLKEKTKQQPQPEKAAEDIFAWGKKNLSYPDDMRHNEKASFDQMLARMYDGKDFYKEFGDIDSADREKVFGEMAKRTGLNYDDIYYTWLQGHEIDLDSSNVNYEAAVKAERNVRQYLQKLTDSPRQRELEQISSKRGRTEKEDDEHSLRRMVASVWTYGDGKDSSYLTDEARYTSLTPKEKKKIIDDEWDYLDKHVDTGYAGTDSEGVTYQSRRFRR